MASPAGDIGLPSDRIGEKAVAPPKPVEENVAATLQPSEVKTVTVEEADDLDDVPDPDEDDLDDLDGNTHPIIFSKIARANKTPDLLDEFSAAKLDPKQPQVPSGPGKPATAEAADPSLDDAFSDDEFAKQLQAGMAELLGDMEDTVSVLPPLK